MIAIGWLFVRPKVVANTGGRLKSIWTDDGPRYGDATLSEPDDDAPAH